MTGSGEVAGGPAESGGDLLGAGGGCGAAGEAEYGHGGSGPRRPGAERSDPVCAGRVRSQVHRVLIFDRYRRRRFRQFFDVSPSCG